MTTRLETATQAAKRLLLRLAALALLAGLLGRCENDTIPCEECKEDYRECAAECAGFRACEQCREDRDECLEDCGDGNMETSCEDYPEPGPQDPTQPWADDAGG